MPKSVAGEVMGSRTESPSKKNRGARFFLVADAVTAERGYTINDGDPPSLHHSLIVTGSKRPMAGIQTPKCSRQGQQ